LGGRGLREERERELRGRERRERRRRGIDWEASERGRGIHKGDVE